MRIFSRLKRKLRHIVIVITSRTVKFSKKSIVFCSRNQKSDKLKGENIVSVYPTHLEYLVGYILAEKKLSKYFFIEKFGTEKILLKFYHNSYFQFHQIFLH